MSVALPNHKIGYPAAARMARVLEERIQRGQYEAGTWLPAERTLADEFGVDRAIVRAALDHLQSKALITREPGRRPWVSPLPPPVPSRFEQRVTTGEAGGADAAQLVTVAAILPHHPVYPAAASLLKGIQQAFRAAAGLPCRLLFFDTYPGDQPAETLEKQALEAICADTVAGVIFWPSMHSAPQGQETLPLLRALSDQEKPVVFVDRYYEGEVCDFVGVDNQSAARSAVEYLLRLGHTRIAHLTNTDPAVSVAARAAGYREALQQAGITPDPALAFTVPVGQNLSDAGVLDQIFALPNPPTAVFAMNDSLAHRLIQGLEERGARVPGSISVIGFDDLERFSPRPALLTTIHQPFDLIGQRAAELLLQRLRVLSNRGHEATGGGSSLPGTARQHILLPTPLIERSTCRALAGKAESSIRDTTKR